MRSDVSAETLLGYKRHQERTLRNIRHVMDLLVDCQIDSSEFPMALAQVLEGQRTITLVAPASGGATSPAQRFLLCAVPTLVIRHLAPLAKAR